MYTPVYRNYAESMYSGGGGGACAVPSGGFASGVAAALQFFAAAQCMVGEPWPVHSNVPDGSSFDFIIVGGGTAGAALAARLSEEPAFSVLLLEAGGDPPQESVVPVYKDYLKNTKYDWNFTTADDGYSSQALRGGRQKQPRGRMLGGTGSINDMVYARGFPADYRRWADVLGPEWDWPDVLPYFKKTEHLVDERILNDPELAKYHGTGGEITVSGSNEAAPVVDKLLGAFSELGYQRVQDMTNPDRIGAGRFSHTIRDGRRDGTLPGMLARAAQRDNLAVLKHTLVTKLLIENKEVRGVRATAADGEEVHYYANMEVIVSAGTFNTPKLLLLSGIGPKTHLDSVGIDTVADLPVGENLHDHVMVPLYVAAAPGTCPADLAADHMQTVRYLYDRSGALASTNSVGAYYTLKDSKDRAAPDFGIYPTCIAPGTSFRDGCTHVLGYKDDICEQLAEINADKELLSLVVVLLNPASRGRVRLATADPKDEPVITTGTFSMKDDLKGFPEAMLSAMAVAGTSHFAALDAEPVYLEIEECAGVIDAHEYLRCYARSMATAAWHAAGTAALGSVSDARFAVRGVRGLRVVDASAMPRLVRANTNAPVVMLAERAADFIKEDYGDNSVRGKRF